MRTLLLGLCLVPLTAAAQVYKCVGHDGSTSYSAVPCPAASGEALRIIEPAQPSGPAVPYGQPAEEPSPASPEQRSSTGSRVTVVEDSEAADRTARAEDMREEALQYKRDMYAPRPSLEERKQNPSSGLFPRQ
ncbi:DUF4124 domain-containing protein [Pseudomonas sp. JM0905a]|uniref:DUF4124 domain-containing protein n=1 Tax=Metapseudomonas resinovorans TaxID=53412 RepID=A0ABT4Y1N3_METRE|nr:MULTISPECIES: DUF4124 domain-containing protein [Pseudomonas]MBD2839246.1 DUF4124 domain-containing protein [Pseudomonas sp. JM0905a]MDA8482706.1 DUF4124 domain-containing protein [Pseudomonas resinovorans]